MPYSLSIPQDNYCRDVCKCQCGYAKAREVDNWRFPPTNPEVVLHSTGEGFYAPWRKQDEANRKAIQDRLWETIRRASQ